MFDNDPVNHPIINAPVIVNEAMPHPRDQWPGDPGVGKLKGVGQLPAGLPDDFDAPADSEKSPPIRLELSGIQGTKQLDGFLRIVDHVLKAADVCRIKRHRAFQCW